MTYIGQLLLNHRPGHSEIFDPKTPTYSSQSIFWEHDQFTIRFPSEVQSAKSYLEMWTYPTSLFTFVGLYIIFIGSSFSKLYKTDTFGRPSDTFSEIFFFFENYGGSFSIVEWDLNSSFIFFPFDNIAWIFNLSEIKITLLCIKKELDPIFRLFYSLNNYIAIADCVKVLPKANPWALFCRICISYVFPLGSGFAG